jgi:hypothetical protein
VFVLFKWVRCRVVDEVLFDAGQRGWVALRGVPGFVAQAGGRSLREPGVVHIFAWWGGEEVYADFMVRRHDAIAAAQAGSYTDLKSRLFRVSQPFAGLPGVVGVVTGPLPAPVLRSGVFAVNAGADFVALTFSPSGVPAELVEIDAAWTVIRTAA